MNVSGKAAELFSCFFLFLKGYTIRQRNYSCRSGEIDIIAGKKDFLVFVEVKYRKNSRFGRAEEFVTPSKQKKIKKTALHYLALNKLSENDTHYRFDIIAIDRFKVKHIINAFN